MESSSYHIERNQMYLADNYKQDSINSWTNSYLTNVHNDSNNNTNPLNEPSLILFSTNCMDCNYKSKRLRLAESKFNNKIKLINENVKVLPVMSKLDLFSSLIKLADLNLTSQLGRGSFGVVFSGEITLNNRTKKLAVKVIQNSNDSLHKQQLFKSYLAEQNIRFLRHPNLIAQLGYNDCDPDTKSSFIIYEYGGKYNLNQLIFDSDIEMNANHRKSFSLDLIKALEYIHSNKIVHLDLKPANVIVTDALVCKLTDFGCSVKLGDQCRSSQTETDCLSQPFIDGRWTAGTWFYRAPELFRTDNSQPTKQANVTTKCDIYSLSIVMWQLLTRESPYHEDPHVIIYQIVTKNLRPQFPIPNISTSINKPHQSLSASPSCFNIDKSVQSNHHMQTTSIPSSQSSSMTNSNSSLSLSSLSFSSSTSSSSIENITKKWFNPLTRTNKLNLDILTQTRSATSIPKLNQSSLTPTSTQQFKSVVDNSSFEKVYRDLIINSWSDDPNKRHDAKTLREILQNTKISY